MANHVSHASLPFCVKNARYTIPVVYLDADGDPLDPTTPDTEFSLDGAAFTDCAEEVATITGGNGAGYVTLTGAETNGSLLIVCAKVASGPKATLLTAAIRTLPILESGTAQAGAAGTLTLAAGAPAYDISGSILRTTGGTGGGGTGGANNQARVVTAYDTSTKVATVVPNWETTPDGTTTYDVLLTEMAGNAVRGRFLRATTDGRTLDVSAGGEAGVDWANVGSPTTTVGLSGTTVKTATDVEADTADIQTRLPAALVSGRIDASVGAMAAGAVQAIWDALTSALTTAGSIGKFLVDRLDAAVSSRSTVTTAQVNAEVVDALDTDTYAELSGVPAATVSIRKAVQWLFMLNRNKATSSGALIALRNDADSATLATSVTSDDGTTYTRSEWS